MTQLPKKMDTLLTFFVFVRGKTSKQRRWVVGSGSRSESKQKRRSRFYIEARTCRERTDALPSASNARARRASPSRRWRLEAEGSLGPTSGVPSPVGLFWIELDEKPSSSSEKPEQPRGGSKDKV